MTNRRNGFLALLLILTMALSLCPTAIAEDIPEVTMLMIQFEAFPSEAGILAVEEAVNAITIPKIGVRVNLEYFPTADYQTNIVLRHASGEPCDLFVEAISDVVAAGRAADITELVTQYAPEAIQEIGERSYTTCMIDGRCYGLPSNKYVIYTCAWTFRKDLMDAAGIDVGEPSTFSDLTPIFDKFHEAYPDMYPIYINSGDQMSLLAPLKEYGFDYLCESSTFNFSGACLLGDESQKNLKVVNVYESDYFKEAVKTIREWYLKGYISPDAVTAAESKEVALKSGNYASCVNVGNKYLGISMSDNTGLDIDARVLGNYTLESNSYNVVPWVVSSQCKNPEAAVKFLNLTYTDPEIINLIVWGIEGRDYVLCDNGQARYPDGMDANSVPYTCATAAFYLGTQWYAYARYGMPEGVNEYYKESIRNARLSNAMGFIFDPADVMNEISATVAVVDEYMPGLLAGVLDLDIEYDKFIQQLYDAGLQTVIDAKQAQLDDWAAKYRAE